MDFADSHEHAAFRAEFRRRLEDHLPPEICVDDAADHRVAPTGDPPLIRHHHSQSRSRPEA